MKKTILLTLLLCAATLLLCACGGREPAADPSSGAKPTEVTAPAAAVEAPASGETTAALLTEEEIETIKLFGEDLIVVDDESFGELVSEIVYHVGAFDGTVLQLEGQLKGSGEDTALFRVLTDGDKETQIRLPLRYLSKEIPEGSWIRVTGIVNHDQDAGSVLDTVAIEALPEQGQVVLNWSGSAHNHG